MDTIHYSNLVVDTKTMPETTKRFVNCSKTETLARSSTTNEVWGRVMFSQACVIPSVHSGVRQTPLARHPLDIHPPDTPGKTPPVDTPWPDTHLRQPLKQAVHILLGGILVGEWVVLQA